MKNHEWKLRRKNLSNGRETMEIDGKNSKFAKQYKMSIFRGFEEIQNEVEQLPLSDMFSTWPIKL